MRSTRDPVAALSDCIHKVAFFRPHNLTVVNSRSVSAEAADIGRIRFEF